MGFELFRLLIIEQTSGNPKNQSTNATFCRFSNDQVVKIISAYFSEELEPFPGAQSAPGTDVALDNEQTHLLVVSSLEILESQVRSEFLYSFLSRKFSTPDSGLEVGHDLSEDLVTDVLKTGENTGLEEDLRVTDLELFVVEVALGDELVGDTHRCLKYSVFKIF